MKESTIESRYDKLKAEALKARLIISGHSDFIRLSFDPAVEPPKATILCIPALLLVLDGEEIKVALRKAVKAGDLLKEYGWEVE